MKQRLVGSLRHIAARVSEATSIDMEGFERALILIESSRLVSPNAYGIYHDILLATSQGNLDELQTLFDEFTSQDLALELPLFSDYLGDDRESARKNQRYARYFNADTSSPVDLQTPSPQTSNKVREFASEGTALINRTCPELGEEINQLVSEVIFCSADAKSSGVFGGAACFMVWGAVLMNADLIHDPVQYVEAISHESGHVKLFAYAANEPLVLNPPKELYSSPLRSDPRPMDGIFHATYVLARMHWAANHIYRSERSDSDLGKRLLKEMKKYQTAYEGGLETIRNQGQLSKTGDRLISAAAKYMNQESMDLF